MSESIAEVRKAWGILHAELQEEPDFDHTSGQDGEPECPLCNALFAMDMAVARLGFDGQAIVARDLAAALTDLLKVCEWADFKNGVCAGVGHPDEGEHWAAIFMENARAALLRAQASEQSGG